MPDPENGRLLVYNSGSSEAREGIDIVDFTELAGAMRLDHLNPQTQMFTID